MTKTAVEVPWPFSYSNSRERVVSASERHVGGRGAVPDAQLDARPTAHAAMVREVGRRSSGVDDISSTLVEVGGEARLAERGSEREDDTRGRELKLRVAQRLLWLWQRLDH